MVKPSTGIEIQSNDETYQRALTLTVTSPIVLACSCKTWLVHVSLLVCLLLGWGLHVQHSELEVLTLTSPLHKAVMM
jgi:hypothetical protein